jgi:hypothetical protein
LPRFNSELAKQFSRLHETLPFLANIADGREFFEESQEMFQDIQIALPGLEETQIVDEVGHKLYGQTSTYQVTMFDRYFEEKHGGSRSEKQYAIEELSTRHFEYVRLCMFGYVRFCSAMFGVFD